MKAEPVKKSTGKKSSAPSSQDPPKRRSSTPPPAVNEPLAFITFVATYPVGTTLEGEVVSFTSHGAMVDVALPDGGSLHCYIPLSAMGDPPPTKARQVLTKGEVRLFVLSSLDPPRRVAELSLPAPPAKKRRSPTKKAAKARS
jgi:ribosomal protein S1